MHVCLISLYEIIIIFDLITWNHPIFDLISTNQIWFQIERERKKEREHTRWFMSESINQNQNQINSLRGFSAFILAGFW